LTTSKENAEAFQNWRILLRHSIKPTQLTCTLSGEVAVNHLNYWYPAPYMEAFMEPGPHGARAATRVAERKRDARSRLDKSAEVSLPDARELTTLAGLDRYLTTPLGILQRREHCEPVTDSLAWPVMLMAMVNSNPRGNFRTLL
jgi:hypothetical protein